MLKGTRDAVLHRIQPISIHGQLSYDLHYRFVDEPDSQLRVARIGGEAIGPGVQEGERVRAFEAIDDGFTHGAEAQRRRGTNG